MVAIVDSFSNGNPVLTSFADSLYAQGKFKDKGSSHMKGKSCSSLVHDEHGGYEANILS
jgi:hypothetical protein